MDDSVKSVAVMNFDNLMGVCQCVLAALKYPRGSEARQRAFEEVGQDVEWLVKKIEGGLNDG